MDEGLCFLYSPSFFYIHPPSFPYTSPSCFSSDYLQFLGNLSHHKEPSSYEEAKDSPERVTSMNKKLMALDQNNTWNMVDLPLGKKAIGCRWIFRIKHNPDGTIEHYKACLVAKSYNQI